MNALCLIFLQLFSSLSGGENKTGYDRSVERNHIIYTIGDNSWTAISGTTNVNSFECLSPEIGSNGIIITELNYDSRRIYFSDASLIMDVNSFDCRNPLITRDMARTLGGDQDALIYITLQDAELKEGYLSAPAGNFNANATISINERTKEVELAIKWKRSGNMDYHFEGSANLSMADFNITPPSPALGMIKVDDKITVRFNYTIRPGIISSLD
jgi:hypothetical protein